MNVSLTPELEALVRQKLESGLYHSASEVVREGLRLLNDRDRFREVRLQQLKTEIDEGLADLRRGRVVKMDAKAIKAEARRQRSAGK
jgi:antitoxin ParD1/3/4